MAEEKTKDLHTMYDPEEKGKRLTKWHYVAIAGVLIIIVLAILFSPIGGSALRLPF